MSLDKEQATLLAKALLDALETVMYGYDKSVPITEDVIESMRRIISKSHQLLGD